MKIFLILLIVSAAFCAAPDQHDEMSGHYHNRFFDQVQIISYRMYFDFLTIYSIKLEHYCPNITENLIKPNQEASECFYRMNGTGETVCTTLKTILSECSQPAIKVLEDCLPENVKNVPAFLVQSAVATLDYICKIQGEDLIELAYLVFVHDLHEQMKCTQDVTNQILHLQKGLKNLPPKLPTKFKMCSLVESARPCVNQYLREDPSISERAREAVSGLYDAVSKPCNISDNLL